MQVTIEVSSSETHDFIPRLMHCLTSDTEETKQVWLLRNYKGTEPDGTYILSSKEVALECGEGFRKRHPTHWYEVVDKGIWDGWEGRVSVHSDPEGKVQRIE